jgi:hypothetical protein
MCQAARVKPRKDCSDASRSRRSRVSSGCCLVGIARSRSSIRNLARSGNARQLLFDKGIELSHVDIVTVLATPALGEPSFQTPGVGLPPPAAEVTLDEFLKTVLASGKRLLRALSEAAGRRGERVIDPNVAVLVNTFLTPLDREVMRLTPRLRLALEACQAVGWTITGEVCFRWIGEKFKAQGVTYRDLAALARLGYLVRSGEGRYAVYYRLAPRLDGC